MTSVGSGRSESPRSIQRPWLPILSGLGVLILSSGMAASADPVGGGLSLPSDPIRGRLLFEGKHCNRCHGIAGRGPDIGPELGGGHFSGTFLDLGAALWNHVPAMSVAFDDEELAWPELSPGEALQLIAFLFYIDYLGEPGDASSGRRLFTTRGCQSCHSIGSEAAGVGPDLADLNRFASPLYIAQAIWNHGPPMLESMQEMDMSPPTFKEGDLADLSAYIRQVGQQGTGKPILLAPGNPNRGRELFQTKHCTACHPAEVGGGGSGPDLRQTDLPRSSEAIASTMWNHALAMRAVMEARGIEWPRFTTQELADLTSFLYFLPFADPQGDPARGAEAFATRSCADCHSGEAGSTHPGPDLTGAEVAGSPAALVSAMWNHAPVMKEAVLSEGRPWPELTGDELRDLYAFLRRGAGPP